MKYILILLLAFNVNAQKLHHQMISVQASNSKTTAGTFVKQTIGQQSVIGNSQKNKMTVSQGFQKSNGKTSVASKIKIGISTVVYPNPVEDKLNFRFSSSIPGNIKVVIFDLLGRAVYQEEKSASQNILTIDNINLPSGSYIIKLNALNYEYSTKILKIK
jgi:hypothetical protein